MTYVVWREGNWYIIGVDVLSRLPNLPILHSSLKLHRHRMAQVYRSLEKSVEDKTETPVLQ